ncbi:type VI secretion system baseplate subunit TssG [Massilia sp. DWR3-1-1]|uniref:type VI secretion system baseplate subunit TssG n=1 Tax=Massilia sp. DWR3-1-1 TaxID=2804559 RepID=UPI003CF3C1F6
MIARLLAQPQRFRFAQAINLVLDALRRRGVSYDAAFRDVIRFSNNVSLSFPASEVQALTVERKPGAPAPHGEPCDAPDFDASHHIRIIPAFIGLLGTAGTLPLHDSERLAFQQHADRDASQHELIDVFSNRIIGLFYESWAKYRVEHGLQVRGRDSLLPMLMALAGRGSGATHRQAASNPSRTDIAAAYYAGVVRTRPVSAAVIERVLSDHFAIPVRVEQFVGCWDEIPVNRRSTFGLNGPVLGRGAVLGTRLWRHDLRARLHIGPLNESRLASFLPGGSARADLVALMALFAVPVIAWEVKLLLAPPCVKRLTLTSGPASRQLGWTSFLTATAGVTNSPAVMSLLRLPMSTDEAAGDVA